MWVIVETKNNKRYTRAFKRKFIKYGIFLLINKIKGNKVSLVYENNDVDKTFNIIIGLCIALIIVLLGAFLYCCYGLYRHKECENISFSTKSCEKWRNY